MSKVKRDDLKKMILKEMKMIGMGEMDILNTPQRPDHGHSVPEIDHGMSDNLAVGTVSREDCCAAVMCLIECCSCPVTREEIARCCSELLSGNYNR